MQRVGWWLVASMLWAGAGCGGSDTTPPPPPPPPADCLPGEHPSNDGMCCPAGTLAAETGGCDAAGIPEDGCAVGFVHQEQSCVAMRPAAPCPVGMMAALGETQCRAVASCGAPPWGDIPLESGALYVDAAFNGTSDGSASKPFTTLQDAFASAAPGAMIVVAAGSYAENLDIIGKPVRLWGRCPELVEVSGDDPLFASVHIHDGAAGSELHGMAITGSKAGVRVTTATGVVLDQLWMHDTARRGLELTLGGSAVVRDSLFELTGDNAIIALGSAVTVERCEIRDTQPLDPLAFGRGISVEGDVVGPAYGDILQTVVSGVHDIGVAGHHAELELAGSLVSGTQPDPSSGTFGRGVNIQSNPGGTTQALLDQLVIEGSHEAGVYVSGGHADLRRTAVRDTQPSANGRAGRGIVTELDVAFGDDSSIGLDQSVVEDNHEAGMTLAGGSATLERSIVRRTLPNGGSYGRGLHVQLHVARMQPANLEARGCVIADNEEFGLAVAGASVTLFATSIERTLPQADAFGDGATAFAQQFPTSLVVSHGRVSDSARAGVSSFGAAIALDHSALICNPIALNAEVLGSFVPSFVDAGDNVCGCEQPADCRLDSTQLAPPQPLL